MRFALLEEALGGAFCLRRDVDFALTQATEELARGEVDNANVVSLVETASGTVS